jgi:anti-anti-sigma factor
VRIDRKIVGDITVLAFTGEFDAMDLGDAHQALGGAIEEDCTRAVFNLSGLTFINSMWIGYLLKTGRDLKARGGELVLSEPSRFFERVGTAIGVGRVITTFPTDQAALEHFGEDGSGPVA